LKLGFAETAGLTFKFLTARLTFKFQALIFPEATLARLGRDNDDRPERQRPPEGPFLQHEIPHGNRNRPFRSSLQF
jgi:hypothetical protein